FAYNKAVDALMARHLGRLEKTWAERVWHALGFELGLLVMTLPLIAWWLSVSLLDALIVDLGLIVFYVLYAFFYNWAYDRVFPPPAVKPPHR
ncbi:MAG: PACE efflux transporter, partial [Methyloversatilis sp.]|nr:PACE efflux transporter [Methyloversatilis sp.]